MGLAEHRLEPRVGVGRPLAPPRPPAEALLHPARRGAGADERHRGDGGGEVAGPEHPVQVPHPRRLHLEDAEGVAGGEKRGGGRVLVGEAVGVEAHAAARLHQLHGFLDGGEGAVSEEIDLHQPHRLDRPHLELGGDDPLGRLLERHVFGQRPVGDHDPPGVKSEVAREPHQPFGVFQDPRPGRLGARDLAPARGGAERLAKRRVGGVGDAAAEPVHHGVGDPVGLGRLAEGGTRLKGVVGRDHGHPVPPVGRVDVLDHLVPPLPAEVHVEIRPVRALLVEEALEGEPVADRVHVGDAENVGRHRAGPAPPPHGGDPALPPPADDLPHHHEVAREAQPVDDPKLGREPPAGGGWMLRVAADEPRLAELPEVGGGGLAGGQRRVGEDPAGALQGEAAVVGDPAGVGQGPPPAAEDRGHGGRRPEPALARGEVPGFEPRGQGVLADRGQGGVEPVVLAGEGHDRPGGHGLEPQGEGGVLDRGEGGFPQARRGEFPPQGLAGEEAGQGPEQLRFGHQHVEAPVEFGQGRHQAETRFEAPAGEKPAEVGVALGVPDEQGDQALGAVQLGAQDRLQPGLARGPGEGDGAVEVVPVGERQGVVPVAGGGGDQRVHRGRSPAEGAGALDVEGNVERHGGLPGKRATPRVPDFCLVIQGFAGALCPAGSRFAKMGPRPALTAAPIIKES